MQKVTSLKSQLDRTHFTITVAVIFACTLGFIANDYYLAKKSLQQIVNATAHVLTQNLSSPVAFNDEKEITRTLDSLSSHPVFKGAIVILENKNKIIKMPPEIPFMNGEESVYPYQYPIKTGGEETGILILIPSEEFKPASWWGYAAVVVIVLSLTLLFAVLLTRIVTKDLLTSLKKFLTTITTIRKSKDFSVRVSIKSEDKTITQEILDLSEGFNEMLSMIEIKDKTISTINSNLEKTVEERTEALKKAQIELIQTTKMSALGEMAAGLAHEVNNPLSIISARSTQIKKMLNDNTIDPEKLNKLAESIETTVTRIAKIIKGLKSFSRDGRQDPLEPYKIAILIEETLALCSSRVESKSIKLEIGKFDSNIVIDCRPSQIEQVLLNLINNAADAIEHLTEKWIKVTVEDNSTEVSICVTDSGNGIPPAIQQKLMQPFFTTKEVGKGTGLGLSISKGILESHGGSLSIDSSCPNTRFIMRIPKRKIEKSPS